MEATTDTSISEPKPSSNPDDILPVLFANTVRVSFSASELQLTLVTNGKGTHKVFLPFPVALSLLKDVEQAIDSYQRGSQSRIVDVGTLYLQLEKSLQEENAKLQAAQRQDTNA